MRWLLTPLTLHPTGLLAEDVDVLARAAAAGTVRTLRRHPSPRRLLALNLAVLLLAGLIARASAAGPVGGPVIDLSHRAAGVGAAEAQRAEGAILLLTVIDSEELLGRTYYYWVGSRWRFETLGVSARDGNTYEQMLAAKRDARLAADRELAWLALLESRAARTAPPLASQRASFLLPYRPTEAPGPSFDTGWVRGPSGGLSLALATLDARSPGDLTGGLVIAASGKVDAEGRVSPIGNIEAKTRAAALAGADLLLTSDLDFDAAVAEVEARGLELEVVSAGDLDEALRAVCVATARAPHQDELCARLLPLREESPLPTDAELSALFDAALR